MAEGHERVTRRVTSRVVPEEGFEPSSQKAYAPQAYVYTVPPPGQNFKDFSYQSLVQYILFYISFQVLNLRI